MAPLSAAGFVAVALGATLVRFWALTSQPGGLYPDEAAEGVSAQRLIADPGYHPIFFDDDGGREATFAYIVSLAFRWFGSSVLVLRSTAAALGVLGVIAVWVAARRFGRWVALVAMAWAATSLWLICVSRDGLHAALTVAAAALLLAAVVRWGARPSSGAAALAGAAAATGLWVYQPLKLAPLFIICWLLVLRRTDRRHYLRLRAGLGWALVAYLVVAAPMLYTATTDWRNYFARAGGVSVFNPGSGSADSYPVHVLKTIGMFLVTGDPNQRHDVDALPLLGPVYFVPFALGVWRAWRRRTDPTHVALLAGLGVFLLPPLLANEGGAPHFLRSLGLAPFVAVLIGVGCLEAHALLLGAGRRLGGVARRAAPVAAPLATLAAVGVLGALSIRTYLARPVDTRFDAYSFADVELAAAADRGPGTAIVIDAYSAYDVTFHDAPDPPTIIAPGTRIANPSVYSLIVAPTRADLAAATGPAIAARAGAVGSDPRGNPVAYEVVP